MLYTIADIYIADLLSLLRVKTYCLRTVLGKIVMAVRACNVCVRCARVLALANTHPSNHDKSPQQPNQIVKTTIDSRKPENRILPFLLVAHYEPLAEPETWIHHRQEQPTLYIEA
jgi:hypothetical protein